MSTGTKSSISCAQADRLLDGVFGHRAGDLPEAVAEHMRECDRCAKLFGWMLAEEAPAESESKLEAAISAKLSAALDPVRPLPSTRVLAGRFIVVFAVLVALLVGVLGAAGVDHMSLVQVLLVAGILGTTAIFLALSLSWQMIPGAPQRIPAPLLIGAFAAGFLLVVASMFPWEETADIFGFGWGCTRMGLMMAVPAAALLVFLCTRGAPLCYARLGACLGATSGLVGLTVLQFSCSHQQAGHLLVWHGGMVLLCIGVGYGVGRIARYLASRRAPRID